MYEENFYAEKGLREGKKKKSGILKKILITILIIILAILGLIGYVIYSFFYSSAFIYSWNNSEIPVKVSIRSEISTYERMKEKRSSDTELKFNLTATNNTTKIVTYKTTFTHKVFDSKDVTFKDSGKGYALITINRGEEDELVIEVPYK